jgi:hypothetical protein
MEKLHHAESPALLAARNWSAKPVAADNLGNLNTAP